MAKSKKHPAPSPKAKKAYVANMKKAYGRIQRVLGAHGHLDSSNKLKK